MTDANEQSTQTLCVNNCGFYGSPLTSYYCSKCYKERAQLPSAGNPLDFTISSALPKPSDDDIENVIIPPSVTLLPTPTPKEDRLKLLKPIQKSPVKQTIRCKECKKRVGIYGFDCKCGSIFCDSHRYSDKHNCTYDYKEEAKKNLLKSNPCVTAAKIEKI